jgi:hypothetical protein
MNIRSLLPVWVALTLVLMSCAKQPANTFETSKTQADLGVIEVIDGRKAIYDLGSGRTCAIVPSVSTNGTVVLDMTVERNGETVLKPKIQTTSGVAVSFQTGGTTFTLTPVVKK